MLSWAMFDYIDVRMVTVAPFFMLLVVILKKINCKVFMRFDSFVRNFHQISLLI